jgi:hypothetical protein
MQNRLTEAKKPGHKRRKNTSDQSFAPFRKPNYRGLGGSRHRRLLACQPAIWLVISVFFRLLYPNRHAKADVRHMLLMHLMHKGIR